MILFQLETRTNWDVKIISPVLIGGDMVTWSETGLLLVEDIVTRPDENKLRCTDYQFHTGPSLSPCSLGGSYQHFHFIISYFNIDVYVVKHELQDLSEIHKLKFTKHRLIVRRGKGVFAGKTCTKIW